MPLQWTPELSVGVAEIDRQHQELYKQANALLDAMSKGKGKAEVQFVVQFLGDYVKKHFEAEEILMRKYHYTGIASHKIQHAGFIRLYEEARRQIDFEGATPTLTLQLQRQLGDWLVNHIGKVDQTLGAFLQTKMGG